MVCEIEAAGDGEWGVWVGVEKIETERPIGTTGREAWRRRGVSRWRLGHERGGGREGQTEREREREGERGERETDGWMDGQRHRERQTDRPTDRQTDRQTDREMSHNSTKKEM